MRFLGRPTPEDDPGEVTRLTGASAPETPIVVPASPAALSTVAPHTEVVEATAGAGAASAGAPGSTPVPTRLSRLGAALDRMRPGRAGRNVRKVMQTMGMAVMAFGFVCILLGWYGASHSPYLYEEVPYLISGGLLGVALVIGGGVLVRCAWTLRQVEEDRRNALAIVRSVDRLERILRSLDETRRTERADEQEPAR
jgi:hypothetical protein